MRSVFTFLTLALLGTTASAQQSTYLNDSVTMGPGYGSDVYYNMSTGTIASPANNNWTLSFQMIPQSGPSSNVAIFANQVGAGVEVYSLHYSATAKFASLAAADTAGRITNPLYNSDTTWAIGALNRQNNPTNLYDFSWGIYNQFTHNVVGDSLYLLKTPTSTYKLWVQEYKSNPVDSIRYTFRIAAFDGTGDTTISIYRKDGFANALFGYYNAPTQTVLSHEPNRTSWDILFTRYRELVTQGPTTLYYPVTGVFQNVGVRVAQVRSLNRDTVSYLGKAYSNNINIIGSDWKSFLGQTGPWTVDSELTYFVRSESNMAYYQLSFTGFGGAGTGKAYFKKRQVGSTTAVNTLPATGPTAFILVPNPARNANVEMMVDARRAENARLLVTDAMGRTVQQNTVALQAGVNGLRLSTAQLATGTYFVTLAGSDWKQTQQLLIAE